MSPPTDDVLERDDGQLLLFEPVKRSTFNPPAEPKRSAADWLVNTTTTPTTESTNVKEETS